MSRDQCDELDPVLDAALRDYSNAEPRAGLEHRVLRAIHPPSPRLWWLAPIFAAAMLLAVIGTHHTEVATLSLHPPLPPSAPMVAIARPALAAKSRKLPHLDRFPRPEPLTPGEWALVRFLQTGSEQARQGLLTSGPIEPLDIEPIKIAELP